MSGLFISLEGGEGSGKTTLVKGLAEELGKRGYPVVSTREPGGCLLSEQIRDLLLKRDEEKVLSLESELLLFLAARAQHLEELLMPSLAQGKIVLCDRYHDSSIAYQGKARGLGMDYVEQMCSLATHGVWPDLTLILDLSPEVGLSRTLVGGAYVLDRIESETLHFHQQVQEGYYALTKKFPERIVMLDGHVSAEEVLKQALEVVEQRLPQLLRDEY